MIDQTRMQLVDSIDEFAQKLKTVNLTTQKAQILFKNFSDANLSNLKLLSNTELANTASNLLKNALQLKPELMYKTDVITSIESLNKWTRIFNDSISPTKAQNGIVKFHQPGVNAYFKDNSLFEDKSKNFKYEDHCLGVEKKDGFYGCENTRGLATHTLADQQVHNPRILTNAFEKKTEFLSAVSIDKNGKDSSEKVSLDEKKTRFISVGGHQTIDPPPIVTKDHFKKKKN